MRGPGIDEISRMIGVQEGVGAYFKREIPTLVQINCISHRLALAEKILQLQWPTLNNFLTF